MNPGIYYLYQYKNNTRVRNTGFLKFARRPQTCSLQIQARMLPVNSQDTVLLSYLFTNGKNMYSTKITTLACGTHTLSSQLTIPDSHFTDIQSLDQLLGFLIELPDGTLLAAANPDVTLDTRTITDSELIEEPEESTAADSPADSVTPNSDPPATNKPEPTPELSASEYIPQITSPIKNIRKIQRNDLSILPRKCWNLANNSFLLHGYHNYHHLLLVEENGHYWVGVPGVYDIREARAAEIFGFPQFTESYNKELDLSDDECTPDAKFGYWCHYIY